MLYQPFPAAGVHLELGNSELTQMFEDGSDTVYAYIMTVCGAGRR